MERHAKVVVIGGGVTGCSWHAAGSLFALTSPSNAAILQKYTIGLYPQLEAESGQSCGYHPVGGIHLARTEDQVMALRLLHSRGKRNGIESEFISIAEAQRPHPQDRRHQGCAARASERLLRSGQRDAGLCEGGPRSWRQGPSLYAGH